MWLVVGRMLRRILLLIFLCVWICMMLMVDCWCSRSQARKLQLLQLCGVWSRQRNFPSSSFVSPTGKCLNIKPPLKSPKLLGYQHPPSPNMQWLFVHHSHSINLYCDLSLDLPTDR